MTDACFQVLRIRSTVDATIGALYDVTGGRRDFLAFTLEDEARAVKVAGETRIPAGAYDITLRTEGGFHDRYAAKFGAAHHGMLWIRNVPGFEFILIHAGNTDEDTRGCLLVGRIAHAINEGYLGDSIAAYREVYARMSAPILRGANTVMQIVDLDDAPPAS